MIGQCTLGSPAWQCATHWMTTSKLQFISLVRLQWLFYITRGPLYIGIVEFQGLRKNERYLPRKYSWVYVKFYKLFIKSFNYNIKNHIAASNNYFLFWYVRYIRLKIMYCLNLFVIFCYLLSCLHKQY